MNTGEIYMDVCTAFAQIAPGERRRPLALFRTITVWDGLTRIEVNILNANTGESPELEMFRPYWEFLIAARKSLLSGKGAVQAVEELSISPLRIWRDGNITKEHAFSEIQALEDALRADGYIHA